MLNRPGALIRKKFRVHPSTSLIISAMTVQPLPDRIKAIDRLVRRLRLDGIWDKLEFLYVVAAHDAQAARLNWINPGVSTLTELNSPTFVADRGYTGNGTTSGLSGGPNLSLSSIYTLNSAHMGVWCLTDATENVGDIGGVNNNIRSHAGATTMNSRANQGTSRNATISPATAVGHSVYSRNNSADYSMYKDTVDLGVITEASTAISNATITLCFVGGGFATKQVAIGHGGSALTSTEVANVYASLLSYMQFIGAA